MTIWIYTTVFAFGEFAFVDDIVIDWKMHNIWIYWKKIKKKFEKLKTSKEFLFSTYNDNHFKHVIYKVGHADVVLQSNEKLMGKTKNKIAKTWNIT